MGTTTKIQWCDSTASPWTGCTPVSAGCDNCYARTMAKRRGWCKDWGAGVPRHRFVGFERAVMAMERKAAAGWFRACLACGWRGFVRTRGEGLGTCECYKRRFANSDDYVVARPRVFPSLCDWLDPEVPVNWLADLLDVIRRTPHLDWMLLTKRPGLWLDRMEEVVAGALRGDSDQNVDWLRGEPPANVWIGATCENQETADERVRDLLGIPAARRFVSVEPMLGPVDIRLSVGSSYGRGDKRLRKHAHVCGQRGGSCGMACKCWCHGVTTVEGRPCADEIDAVFCGGEPGPDARPMHPKWVRSLRDQCVEAGVPFTFKQWGEYAPGYMLPGGFCLASDRPNHVADVTAGRILGGVDETMFRVGAKRAGRLLDGREWNQMPEQGKDGAE